MIGNFVYYLTLAAAILLVWMRPSSNSSSDPLPLMPAMELVLHGDDPWGVRSAGGPTESTERCKTWARPDEPVAFHDLPQARRPTPVLQFVTMVVAPHPVRR